ncbi:MAG: DUF3817 domain-containing protein [Bacteroidota bacterium]
MQKLKNLQRIGVAEAISFILLMFIAMPLKYLADIPEPVTYLGWAHGVLFILFCSAAGLVMLAYKKSIWWFAGGFIAALLPFGPFVWDKKVLQPMASELEKGTAEA